MPSIRFAAFIIVGRAAQLGLAIVGWGGFAGFFSHPPLVALAIAVALLACASLFTGGNLNFVSHNNAGNRGALGASAVILLLSAFLPAYTDRREFWVIDGDTVRWWGMVIFAIGGVLRTWPVFQLGRLFSGLVTIQPEHTLITTGVYSYIRNPSYLGIFVGLLGWGLAFRSYIGVLLAVFILPVLIVRIRAEEALLRKEFGREYDAYCARTSRLIPMVY